MLFKDGVKVNGTKQEIVLCIMVADRIWANYGQELVITAVTDGKHSRGSLHYVGYAVDFRTNYFGKIDTKLVAKDLRDSLTDEYDIVVEETHIHIEYQPKD